MVTRSTTAPPSTGEKLFAVLCLFYSTAPFFPLLQGERDLETTGWVGNFTTNLIWIMIYLGAAWFLLRHCPESFAELKKNWVLLIIVVLGPVSLLWSVEPILTLLRSGAMFGTALVANYLRFRYTPRELLTLCSGAISIAAVCTVFFVVFLPQYGLGSGEFDGSWLGIYGQKNNLGAIMAIGYLVSILLYKFTPGRRFKYLLFAGCMLGLVYLSDSATSLIICLTFPFFLWAIRLGFRPSKHPLRRRLSIVVCVAVLAFTIASDFEGVTAAVGRNEGLSGRTALWLLVFEAIQERPLLGYGYEAFWQSDKTPAASIWSSFGQNLFYSHNGLVEVWLGLGLVGVLVILTCLVVVFRRSLNAVRKRFCLESVWPLAFLFYLLLSNLTEVSFMKGNTLPWLLFLTVVQVSRGTQSMVLHGTMSIERGISRTPLKSNDSPTPRRT
jgi:exopolysaccharide production protein ExoQ